MINEKINCYKCNITISLGMHHSLKVVNFMVSNL